jgi:hypothetical protein
VEGQASHLPNLTGPGAGIRECGGAIRKELWRQIGHRVDTAEIVRLLGDTLLRPNGLQGSA